ncbi:MAG TPA: C39 family peptidase [Nitrospirota bacterium]|nr:C39 family peptidase [Nitrospirota bacterium]
MIISTAPLIALVSCNDDAAKSTGSLFLSVVVTLLIMLSAGCSEKSFASLQPGLDQGGHYISGVLFFKQEDSSCGPAALASVATYWGKKVRVDQVTAKVYLPQLHGTLPMDMENFLREEGFVTVSSAGTLDTLKEQVRKNVPVICLIDLGFSVYRRPHYVTVIGFDDLDAVIIAHDGVRAQRVMHYNQFLRAWSRAGNWMLVAHPEASQDQGRQ